MISPASSKPPQVPPAMARHLEAAREALAAWRAEARRAAVGGLPLRDAIDFTLADLPLLADAAANATGQPHAAKALTSLAKAMTALAAAYSERGGTRR